MRTLLFALIFAAAYLQSFAARVDTLTIDTKYLTSPEKVIVITPEGHDGPRPSVYLLNGYSGDHTAWLRLRPDLPQIADERGFVFVMPDGRDSWYWDSPQPGGELMESFFVNDLIPYIDSHYPTAATASKRAISGLSMGGQGAMYLGIRHPELFANIGSMSGGLDYRPFSERWKIKNSLGDYETNKEVWDAHCPIELIKDIKPGTQNFTIDCGKDDFFAQVNENFHQEMNRCGIDHDYTVRPGAHTGKYWANSILYHLLFFSERFK